MKTIKLTNEQAVALYNKEPELRTTLLHDFTDEELGIKLKPFRWEDLDLDHRNIYPSVKDAEKAIAHCQLVQLAKHYNKCDQHEIEGDYYSAYYDEEAEEIECCIYVHYIRRGMVLKFKNKNDLKKCIEDNRELWEIYLGVK